MDGSSPTASFLLIHLTREVERIRRNSKVKVEEENEDRRKRYMRVVQPQYMG